MRLIHIILLLIAALVPVPCFAAEAPALVLLSDAEKSYYDQVFSYTMEVTKLLEPALEEMRPLLAREGTLVQRDGPVELDPEMVQRDAEALEIVQGIDQARFAR